jgi:hypothetical protein
MFDGTDLSLAYGSAYDTPAPPPPVQEPVVSKAAASHAMPPEVPYTPPPAMYAQQSPTAGPVMAPPADTFWDRLARKKWEVIKLVVLSLVVLLAISMDRVASHYLTNYISKSFLTDMQEFLVRLSYPVFIILVLWVIKASA